MNKLKNILILIYALVGSCVLLGCQENSTKESNTTPHQISTTKAKKQDKADLEQEVSMLLKGDQILLRREIDKVYTLAKMFEAEGKEIKAIQLFEKALEVNSSNIPYQMRLAKLLAAHDDVSGALIKARFVYQLAEDDELIKDASTLLQSLGHPPKSREAIHSIDNDIKIIIVPLGTPNPLMLQTLKEMLEDRMGISFPILSEAKDMGSPDRSFTIVFVNDYIKWLKEKVGDSDFPKLVKELGFTLNELNSYKRKVSFIKTLFKKQGADGLKALMSFNKELQNEEKHKQFDTARLILEMRSEYVLKTNSSIKGYLAISNKDLFEGNSRFRFGGALPGYGVISYHRFTSNFNKENQNRPRLIKRTLKQALSSANFILGIPRCTTPNCARSYPNSLQELDQKSDSLCPICVERLLSYRHSVSK